MRKKVRSFALEEEPYEKLLDKFRDNFVDINISYCVNRYIKEFLEYLESVEKILQNDSYTVPMAFIIETIARDAIFKKFDSDLLIKEEVEQLQQKYNVYIKKNPEKVQEYDNKNVSDELQYSKFAQLTLKMAWEEKKAGRDITNDEFYDLAKQIGGKDFIKALRTKVKPFSEKLEKYDPDMSEVLAKIINKIFKKQKGEL
jgi:hypothetical protein